MKCVKREVIDNRLSRPLTHISLLALVLSYLITVPASAAGSKQGALNDTGIDYTGLYPKGIVSDCSSSSDPAHVQQDCATGTSVQRQGDGVFRLVKIDDQGNRLPQGATAWSCVLDLTTGLMWEVKNSERAADNLHHKDDKYTWYNSNPRKNGGAIGQWNSDSASCQGYTKGEPRSYCHVEQFVSRVNKKGLCGFRDWRLPNRHELTSIVHFGRFQPSIHTAYFPATLSEFYWAANPLPARPLEAWTIDFEFGTTSPMRKSDQRPARLVRQAMAER